MRFELIIIPLGILFMINLIGGTLTASSLLFTIFVVVIITATTIGVLAGVQILGSGLSTESIHIAFIVSITSSLWLALTLSAMGLFGIIPEGILIYAIISIVYVIGIGAWITRGGA